MIYADRCAAVMGEDTLRAFYLLEQKFNRTADSVSYDGTGHENWCASFDIQVELKIIPETAVNGCARDNDNMIGIGDELLEDMIYSGSKCTRVPDSRLVENRNAHSGRDQEVGINSQGVENKF